jgi:outer membrane protein W
MKKIILTVLLFVSVASGAQTEQGRILVSGSLGFTSSNDNDLDTTGKELNSTKVGGLELTVRGGYFLADNIAVGLLVGLNTNKTTQEDFGPPPSKSINVSKSATTAFGLFGRYYTPPVERRLSFFGQLDLTYEITNSEIENTFINSANVSTTTNRRGEGNQIGAFLAPGVAFFLSDKVALEATFGLIGFASGRDKNYDTSDRQISDNKYTRLETSFSPSTLSFGLTFFFGGNGAGE